MDIYEFDLLSSACAYLEWRFQILLRNDEILIHHLYDTNCIKCGRSIEFDTFFVDTFL